MGKSPNVSEILQSVHTAMITKYAPGEALKAEIQQAQEIQDFLKTLKKRAYERKDSNRAEKLNNDMYDMILDNIVLPNGRTLYNLFRRTSNINKITGQYFEDDLAAVLASVVNLTQSKSQRVTYKNFSLGATTGTTDIDLFKEVQEEIDSFIQDLAKETADEIQKNTPSFVMGKIDTLQKDNLINMNAEFNIPDSLLKALSYASFSDKSYKSIGWDKINKKQIDLGGKTIHLGNSNPYRAVLGSMASLGFSKTDSQYVFYGGRNIAFGNDTTPPPEDSDFVKLHIYHLRYLYELTGAGILYRDYNDSLAGGAKYFVYNDPNSEELIVVSTASIISQLLQSKDVPDNPYGSIGISKAFLRQQSK